MYLDKFILCNWVAFPSAINYLNYLLNIILISTLFKYLLQYAKTNPITEIVLPLCYKYEKNNDELKEHIVLKKNSLR